MEKKRPMHLDLLTIKFPLTAIASILHRLSGFVIFFLIPLSLSVLQLSLSSAVGFASVANYLHRPMIKLTTWVFVIALTYHLLAGIRHLFSDFVVADTLPIARRTAIVVFMLTIVVAVLLGYWLW